MKFYVIVLESSDKGNGNLYVLYLWAENISHSLDRILSYANSVNIPNPVVRQIDPYDFDKIKIIDGLKKDGEVYISEKVYSFNYIENYHFPQGIIASCMEGKHDISEVEVGYKVIYENDGLIKLTLNSKAELLLSTYNKLLAAVSHIDTFWIRISAEWDCCIGDIFYINQNLNSSQSIYTFINEHQIDLLFNGYVTLTSYVNQGKTNISIDDHKLIIVLSYDKQLISNLCTHLEENNIHRRHDLITIQDEVYHWHYHHVDGKSKKELISFLTNKDFRYWNPMAKKVPDNLDKVTNSINNSIT